MRLEELILRLPECPASAGDSVKTVTKHEAGALSVSPTVHEAGPGHAPTTAPERPPARRRGRPGLGRSPAWSPRGRNGKQRERPRPPFNLAAGAGLAEPPGPCGLPGSVPAPLNRSHRGRAGTLPQPCRWPSGETP
uniref:Uncharacterized protein n=1 Tax=Rangifer tarandus platyrhynchus TaxID=3082113 RepID=A0ACB0F3N2_RANTA|nr:unnamed protein product [Rangifer tarandus platyrhynchus]